jgi:type I restriction enzyme S subunit
VNAKKLEDLCDFISGLWTGKKPPYVSVGVIRNTNFHKSGNLDFTDIAQLEVEVKQFSTRQLKFGDIVLEKSGGGPKQPVGRVCVFEKEDGLYSLSNFTSAIRIKNPKELDYRYLHYYLKHLYIAGETEKIQTHSTGIRNLQLSQYKEFSVPLPTLSTQKKIVSKLDTIFAEIDKAMAAAEANAKNTEVLFQSYLSKVFKADTADWKTVSFGDVLVKTENINPVKEPSRVFQYVDVSSVSKEILKITEPQIILGKDAPSRARKLIKKNDVLFATVRPTLRRIALVPEELDGEVCSTGYFVLRSNGKLLQKFIFYFLLRSEFMEEMEKIQTGASYPAVNDKQVLEQIISFPPLDVQKSIVAKLDIFSEEIAKSSNSYRVKVGELTKLKQSILTKAFSGDLVKE